jgi:hypothetical protein
MSIINLPANPTTGQIYTASNSIDYTWDGEKWITNNAYVPPVSPDNTTGNVLWYNTSTRAISYGPLPYSPSTPSDWNSTPNSISSALDELASGIKSVETVKISLSQLKTVVASSTSFIDFQSRIAAL